MLRPTLLAVLLLAALPGWAQSGIVSIGDAVRTSDAAASRARSVHARGLTPNVAPRPIHILYMHGINQVGAGDSAELRKAICRYLHECSVTLAGRFYAAGPFAAGAAPPPFDDMGAPIWTDAQDWSASAPFIDRYRIEGNGHVPIVLDEINWWPIVYPVKCKWLIEHDAALTGPARAQLDICAAAPHGTEADPAHPGRFLQYQWIPATQMTTLDRLRRLATIGNRNLKNGLMDWGFADAVLALGPTQQILYAGIRELLVQSLQADGVDLSYVAPNDPGPEYYFITHSLGSYLALATLDAQSFGPQSGILPAFAVTQQQRTAIDYLSAHTASFFFLANQIELLELAHVGPVQPAASEPCAVPAASAAPATPAPTSADPSGTAAPASISHWECERAQYLQQQSSQAPPMPQIVAWSDPNDLLSWNVPAIGGVHVVNISVHNAAFRIPPLIVSPTGAHANYAENRKILRAIFAPTPSS
ncbi:MAG TPA: hypothetical protein VL990_06300 [Acidobacteriaceae bacterium]|nr:hypothetical protein [Acidobacteriaceae bacterium]